MNVSAPMTMHARGFRYPLRVVAPVFLSALVLPLALSVQINALQPASVPPGAQRVTMLELTFASACSGDTAIHGLALTHRGMGDIRDLKSVYAMSGGRRISRGRALNTGDGTVTLTFRPALTVPACGEQGTQIMADFSADAAPSGEHTLSVLRAADIDAGGAGVTIRTADAPVRSLAGVEQGSVAAAFLPLLTRVTYGDHRTVARLRLAADGAYDQIVDAVTFTNDGSARDTDLQRLTLETSRGQVLARLSALQGHRAPFVLASPLSLERGQVSLLTVRADVRAGRRRTIGFSLEEPGDLVSRRARSRR